MDEPIRYPRLLDIVGNSSEPFAVRNDLSVVQSDKRRESDVNRELLQGSKSPTSVSAKYTTMSMLKQIRLHPLRFAKTCALYYCFIALGLRYNFLLIHMELLLTTAFFHTASE